MVFFVAKKKAKGSKLKAGIVTVCALAAVGAVLPDDAETPVKETPAIVQNVEVNTPQKAPANITKTESSSQQTKKVLVGSSASDKYHVESCRWAKEIKESNLVYFDSIDHAKESGYVACGTCSPK